MIVTCKIEKFSKRKVMMSKTTERKTPIEEDVPKNEDFSVATDNIQQKNDRDWFNTIKGHNLLGWCVGLLFSIYLLELFFDKGKISEVGNSVIEIFKLLIFSLTGYLFGTHSNKENK